jgi:hypothetical protein
MVATTSLAISIFSEDSQDFNEMLYFSKKAGLSIQASSKL